MHWPNFLNKDPEKNMETVARWIKYFEQYKNNFEILPARDNAIGSTQALYKRFTNLSFCDGRMVLDFSEVDAQGAKDLDGTLYVNIVNTINPKADEAVDLKIYEVHENYTTYKVERRKPFASKAVISFAG